MPDHRQHVMNNDPDFYSGIEQQIADELDAITAPADVPEPIVTEFMITSRTPPAIIAALPQDELRHLEDALADFDLAGDDERLPAEPTVDWSNPPPDRPAFMNLIRARQTSPEAVALHEDNKANGWTARAYDEIDGHRKGEGREAENKRQRDAYKEEIGREPRAYAKATPERRKDQKAAAKKKALENMTPDQLTAFKAKKAEDERIRRARKRAAAEAAKTIF